MNDQQKNCLSCICNNYCHNLFVSIALMMAEKMAMFAYNEMECRRRRELNCKCRHTEKFTLDLNRNVQQSTFAFVFRKGRNKSFFVTFLRSAFFLLNSRFFPFYSQPAFGI